jgi:hypothetical protein
LVQESINNPDQNTAIRFPECPRCKQPIRRCTRYMPIINQVHNLIEQVKKKILGNHSDKDMKDRRKTLIKKYEETEFNLKEVDLGQMRTFFALLYETDNIFSNDILILMGNILLFVNEIEKLLIDGRKKLQINIFEDLVSILFLFIAMDKEFILYRLVYL